MRPALIASFANIQLHSTESVDWESLVRINGNTEKTGVCVDELILVADNRIPENTGVTKISEVSHVSCTVIASRVYLTDLVFLEDLDLSIDIDRDLVSIL
jgi:hypothetical protein